MSIFPERHPAKAIELIKYTDLIRKLAGRFPGRGWVNYDKEFRMEQSQNPTRSWSSYDPELFLEKLALPMVSSQQQAFRNQQLQSTTKYCFRFNKGQCKWDNCKFAHRCSSCLQFGHAASACRAGNKRGPGGQGSSPNTTPNRPQVQERW